jgi:succinate dehydrogenase/fumarate reductase flavoprotein subunit
MFLLMKGETKIPLENVVETDVLVIGGGIAGCFAAIKAKEAGVDVTIADKAYAGKSGSSIAASGWWMVCHPEWGHDFAASMEDVTINGEYLNNRDWDEIILKESWAAYQDLVAWGVEFPVPAGEIRDYWDTRLTGPRTARTPSLPWGTVPLRHRKTSPVLRKQAEKLVIKIMDRIMITDLLKRDGKVIGAVGFSYDTGDSYVFKAKATIASGGNNCFRSPGFHTACLTGDADAMAYRAGAEITGKEFPDTHFNLANYPAWKSNAELYAAYMYFTDAEGKRINGAVGFDLFMEFAVHAGKGPVIWDLDAAAPGDVEAMKEYVRKRANPVEAERIGLDYARGGKYPCIGGSAAGVSSQQTAGIWVINTKCATSLPGLYAAGDCCGARVCGASHRGPGFGVTGAAVTGKRAGEGAAEYALKAEKPVIDEKKLTGLKKLIYGPAQRKGGFSPRWVTQLLQNTMIPYFILYIKHGERLQAALTIVEFLRDHLVPKLMAKDAHELRLTHETKNMVLNAEMILRASLFRTESRGLHYREDHPRRDDPSWLAWVKVKEEQGRMAVLKEPLPREWWPDLSKPYKERYPERFPGE